MQEFGFFKSSRFRDGFFLVDRVGARSFGVGGGACSPRLDGAKVAFLGDSCKPGFKISCGFLDAFLVRTEEIGKICRIRRGVGRKKTMITNIV